MRVVARTGLAPARWFGSCAAYRFADFRLIAHTGIMHTGAGI